jgi:tetratricopeptide (TPR) repeat protein
MAKRILYSVLCCAFVAGYLVTAAPALGSQGASSRPKAPADPQRPRASETSAFDRVAAEAEAAREAGRIEESIALYEKAVKLRPSWTEGHWYLGTANYELDRYAPARDAFRRVARDQPENGPAHAFKGLCEFQLKNHETALTDLLRAEELGLGGNQELASVLRYHKAILLTRMEQYEHALQALQSFAIQRNDAPNVIEAFGLAALRMPLLPQEVPPDRRDLVLLAGRGAYHQAGRTPAAAQRAFEQMVERYPDTPHVQYAHGVFLMAEDPDKGIEAFKRELKRTPGHLPSILQIAYEYLRRSDWEAARPWAEEALRIRPDDFTVRRAIGQVLLETGETAGALEHLEAGVRLAPDSPFMRFILARAYQKAGRPSDAERERAEFRRLERLTRTARFGEQAVGGQEPDAAPPQ